ncbi:MAG: hypothetical protein AB4041_14625 [Microcystaceae cyanobacterium]
MLKKLIAPLLIISVVFSILTTLFVNIEALAQGSEAEQPYFVKPLLSSNVIVVEPNYGHFYNPYSSIEGDISGEFLRQSLDELGENYEIADTKMISFERKGKMIPNLYIFLKSSDNNSKIADASIISQNN